MKQQTFDGRLISPENAKPVGSRPSVPVHKYLVEFWVGTDGETREHVNIEAREIDGRSADERAILAAYNQSPYDDIQPRRVTRFKETDPSSSDEWQVEEFLNDF